MRLIVLTFLLALSGCDEPPPRIEVSDAWARETSAAISSAAVYMRIVNKGGPDRLQSVTTAAAKAATFHTTTMDGGVSRMRPITDGIDVAADETLMLRPNETHIMLTGLERPLVEGERIPARLRFARSGNRDVEIIVVGAGAR